MSLICIHCLRIIREMCLNCGTEANPLKTNSNGHAMWGTPFNCPACDHHFIQSQGGETNLTCEVCFVVQLQSTQAVNEDSPV